jgi:hypothetical protein
MNFPPTRPTDKGFHSFACGFVLAGLKFELKASHTPRPILLLNLLGVTWSLRVNLRGWWEVWNCLGLYFLPLSYPWHLLQGKGPRNTWEPPPQPIWMQAAHFQKWVCKYSVLHTIFISPFSHFFSSSASGGTFVALFQFGEINYIPFQRLEVKQIRSSQICLISVSLGIFFWSFWKFPVQGWTFCEDFCLRLLQGNWDSKVLLTARLPNWSKRNPSIWEVKAEFWAQGHLQQPDAVSKKKERQTERKKLGGERVGEGSRGEKWPKQCLHMWINEYFF